MFNPNASPQEQRDLARQQFDDEVERGADPSKLLEDGYRKPAGLDLYSLGQDPEDQLEAPVEEENIYTGSGISSVQEAEIDNLRDQMSRDQAENRVLGLARATEMRASRAARGAHAGEVHAAKAQSTQRLQGYSAPQETEQSRRS